MRIFRLVVVLALCYCIPDPALAQEGGEEAQARAMQVFVESDYSRCDAHFVVKAFEMSLEEAMTHIGQKILWGTTDLLEGTLEKAREKGKTDRGWRCPFHMANFNLDDVQALSAFWGLSTSDTKTRVEDKIVWGNERYLRNTVLPEAYAALGPTEIMETHPSRAAENQAHWDRFQSSDYTLCDAQFMAKRFEMSLDESKVYIGQKLAWGTTDILDGDLKKARTKGQTDPAWRCSYVESGYTSKDAQVLASFWGLTLEDSKTRVEEKILWGNERYLRSELLPTAHQQYAMGAHAEGENYDERALDADNEKNLQIFLASDRYDACHAKMLVGTWFGSQLVEVKSAIGYKLASNYTEQVDKQLEKVRQQHQQATTVPCAFAETRYTPSDAVKLAQAWGQSVEEVKALVERKYAVGTEGLVQESLRLLK